MVAFDGDLPGVDSNIRLAAAAAAAARGREVFVVILVAAAKGARVTAGIHSVLREPLPVSVVDGAELRMTPGHTPNS